MIRTAVIAAALAFAASSVLAQSTPAAKHVAKTAKAPAKKAVVEKPLPPADQAQLDAADRIFLGPYDCEFKQTLDVSADPKYPGYVDVKYLKNTYTMKPVLSSTGALRLEDVKGVTLLIQIANKSMLMDTKAGKRLVDACINEKQRAANDAQPK